MHQILACLWHVLDWYYPLKSEERQWGETCDMKKPSFATYEWNSIIKVHWQPIAQGTFFEMYQFEY